MFRFNDKVVVADGMCQDLSEDKGKKAEQEISLGGDRLTTFQKIRTAGIFVLGPLSGLLFICLLPLLSMLIVVTLLSKMASASDVMQSEEAAMCMGCHANQDVVKTFGNKEKLSVRISERHFKDSVHGFLTCTSCHSTVSMDNHPSANYASRRAFAVQISTACKGCHSDEQLMAKPMHRAAISRSNAPPCSDCHGSHSIRKSAGWKEASTSTSQYCLTCHKLWQVRQY